MEFILLLVSSLLLTTRAAGSSKPVLDVDGDELQTGQLYYALSVLRPEGGLTLVSRDGSCPLNVATARLSERFGRPLAFFPENPTETTVRERNTLYIMSVEPTRCPQSTVWKLDQSYVTTGGTSSAAVGPHDSRFAIYQVGGSSSPDYQIQVCPCSVNGASPAACLLLCRGTLGVVHGQNAGDPSLIALNTNRPLTVNFVKVRNNEQHSSVIQPATMRPRSK